MGIDVFPAVIKKFQTSEPGAAIYTCTRVIEDLTEVKEFYIDRNYNLWNFLTDNDEYSDRIGAFHYVPHKLGERIECIKDLADKDISNIWEFFNEKDTRRTGTHYLFKLDTLLNFNYDQVAELIDGTTDLTYRELFSKTNRGTDTECDTLYFEFLENLSKDPTNKWVLMNFWG